MRNFPSRGFHHAGSEASDPSELVSDEDTVWLQLSSLRSLLILSSCHRFQQVNCPSCSNTTPRLPSGCMLQTSHGAKMRPICNEPKLKDPVHVLFCLEAQVRSFPFQTHKRLTRPTMGLNGLFQRLLWPKRSEQRLSEAFRCIRGKMQRAKITQLLTEKLLAAITP